MRQMCTHQMNQRSLAREEHYNATRRSGLEFLNFSPPAAYMNRQAGAQKCFPIEKSIGAIPFGWKDTIGASRRKHNQLYNYRHPHLLEWPSSTITKTYLVRATRSTFGGVLGPIVV